MANRLRMEGNELIVEPSNASAIAKRSRRKAERQDKISPVTKKEGRTIQIRKYKKKRRFGGSIGKRSPASFQTALKTKFGSGYHEVPQMTYRASQYDFMRCVYIKKKLSERWHVLPDGRRVQRDIMSAFLMYCADNNIESIDRERCIAAFERFWRMHEDCIAEIVQNHLHICNSGIKAA